jgi:hypothetical protein
VAETDDFGIEILEFGDEGKIADIGGHREASFSPRRRGGAEKCKGKSNPESAEEAEGAESGKQGTEGWGLEAGVLGWGSRDRYVLNSM